MQQNSLHNLIFQVSLGPEEGSPSYRIYRVRRVENDHIESILRSPVQMLDLTSCDVTPVGPSILSQALRRLEGLRYNPYHQIFAS